MGPPYLSNPPRPMLFDPAEEKRVGDPDWIRTNNLPLRREPFIALFLL